MWYLIERRPDSKTLLRVAVVAALLVVTAALLTHKPHTWHTVPHHAFTASNDSSGTPELPAVLGNSDTARYRSIFALQQDGKWDEAETLAGKVKNKLLLGHVLAERYLSKDYKSTYAELHSWLASYADLPQAADIYKLAAARRAEGDPVLPAIERKGVLRGYGDDNGLAGVEQDPRWIAGIAAWRAGDMATAAEQFSSMASADDLSPWQSSASAFWAYRALSRQGEHSKASHYLTRASAYPRTFYGVLARKVRGESLGIDTESLPTLDAEDVASLMEIPAVKRTVALMQAGAQALAEHELRVYFFNADREDRPQLLALARALNLPAAQMSMACVLRKNGMPVDAALYPTPDWAPTSGFAVDPSLVFAFARQESGFHAEAHARDGGMGLMQLMPATAVSMRRMTSLSEEDSDPFDPSGNLALGQSYLGYLLQSKQVNDNLIYLAAAYNAGPAKVAQWQREIANNDPLLFMESIPFPLTRNYVKQVLTSYWIYQEIAGHRSGSAMALARGQWPRYDGDNAVQTADAADTRG